MQKHTPTCPWYLFLFGAALAMPWGCTSSSSTGVKKSPIKSPGTSRPALRKVSARIPPPRSKVAKALPQTTLQVEMEMVLKNGPTQRKRNSMFRTFMRARKKLIKMQNGSVWLHLTANTTPPNKLSMTGALKVGQDFKPIVIEQVTVAKDKPWTHTTSAKLKKASATIKIKAQILDPATPIKKAFYKVNFKNVGLHRLLKKVAELNGHKLSLKKDVPNTKGLTLKMKAESRAKLVQKVCQKYALQCKVLGGVLWVQKQGAPPARR